MFLGLQMYTFFVSKFVQYVTICSKYIILFNIFIYLMYNVLFNILKYVIY